VGRYLELVRSAGQKPLTEGVRIKGATSEISPPYFAYFSNSHTPSPEKELNIDETAESKLSNDFIPPKLPIPLGGKGPCELSELSELTRFKESFAALVAKRPARVLNPRYIQAIADAEVFLPVWGERAAALGWTAHDLFGLDPVAPMARYDVMGLLWTTQGCPVVALTERSATIKMPTGNHLVFYRRHRI
jgi:hypothetical protein